MRTIDTDEEEDEKIDSVQARPSSLTAFKTNQH